jgi:hypothetical protein
MTPHRQGRSDHGREHRDSWDTPLSDTELLVLLFLVGMIMAAVLLDV